MDLLKTILLYMSLTFATSVQTAPVPEDILNATPAPTAYVQAATPTPLPTPTPTPVPTINITPNPAYKTIQVGDRGDLVRAMQEKLIEYGYLEGEADGAFGNQTRRAVEAFQYQHGLTADGIAGRRTLTVLYESEEIRLAPSMVATPEPTATAQLMVALTPEPTVESTATPEPTANPTATPTPEPAATPTAAPTQTPEPPFEAMSGYGILVNGMETPLEQLPYRVGETVYLPLVEMLKAAGMNVIETQSVEQDEFAFAVGESLVRVAYTENQQGEPEILEVFVDTEPQILPIRDVRRVDKVVYLPAESIESLTGITSVTDDAAKQITVTIPQITE